MNIQQRESELEKFKAHMINALHVQFPLDFRQTPIGMLCEDMFRIGFALGIASCMEGISIQLNNMSIEDQKRVKKEKSRIILPN